MPDFADHAAATSERDLEDALAAHQARQRPLMSVVARDPATPLNCVDCGEIIPPQRLQELPYTRRCTPCASDIEGRNQWKT